MDEASKAGAGGGKTGGRDSRPVGKLPTLSFHHTRMPRFFNQIRIEPSLDPLT
jgi:hypothetical protein